VVPDPAESPAADPGLESFLPSRLLARLPDTGDRPSEARFEGTVLFADISGFTRLTETLCGAGDEGLERLSALLNQSFSRYVDVVYAHGGEVASFAGDSLLAYWPAGCEEEARRCAEALRSDELHLGLADGPLWVARLGGWFGGWELLVGGPAVREAFECAGRARKGEVVVGDLLSRDTPSQPPPSLRAGGGAPDSSPASARGRSGGGRATTTIDDSHLLARDAPSQAPPSLRAGGGAAHLGWHSGLLPRIVRERGGAPPAELRMISALFVRIDGLDEGAPQALARAQSAVFALREAMTGWAGSAGRLVLDDKGLVFSLVLGDPLNAHSDDAERAMRVGLAVERALGRLGFACSMGFASGRAFCGVIGGERRRQYVAMGRPMNLAARLMEAAEVGLLAAGPLPRVAGLSCAAVGSFQPKGFDRPVPAFRISDQVSDASAPLCGREQEMAALHEALYLVRQGEGGARLLTGEAGIGKSRLIRELGDVASHAGVRRVVGYADAAEVSSSYFAWRGAFRGLLGAQDHGDPAHLRGLLPARLRPGGKDETLAPLLNAVLPLEIAESATTRALQGQSRADATAELLFSLIEEAPGPLVIVLEDCHWMDSASFRLVEVVMTRLPRVLLVLSARTGQVRPELEELRAHARCRVLTLEPLDAAAIEALVCARTGAARVSPPMAAEIERHTGGNAFFVEEFLLYLRASAQLRIVDDRVELDGAARGGTGIPRLQGIVTSRLDGLPAASQLVLKAASAIGQVFSARLLADIHPEADGQSTHAALDLLVRHRLVVAEENGAFYRFAHALVRHVAYELMLFEQRRNLHREIARRLESPDFAELGAGAALLCHHWSAAADDERTLTYADRAATQALQLGACREAIAFLQRCQDLAARVAVPLLSRVRWRRQLSEAAGRIGDLAARRSHAETALALAGWRLARSRGWAMVGTFGRLAWRAFRRRLPLPIGPERSAEKRALALELARIHRQLSVAAYFATDPPNIVRHASSALVQAERAGPSSELVGALSEIGACFGLAGFGGIARRYLNKARRLADRVGDPTAVAWSLVVRCLYLVGRGEWPQAMADANECQPISESLGDHVNWANAQALRFWLHHYQGQTALARDTANALLARAERTGNVQQKAWSLRFLAQCDLGAGADANAAAHLETALDVLSGSEDLNEVVPAWATLALCRWRRGDRQRALTLAHRALEANRGRPTGHSTLEGCSAIVEVLLASHDDPRSPEALRLSARCLKMLRVHAQVFPISRPRYFYWRGHHAWLLGQRGKAAASWRAGLAAAEALGMAPDVARLQARLDGGSW
jgi:class 3 adenylate cyclase/tetratricopeptide (TPR) repeat protein